MRMSTILTIQKRVVKRKRYDDNRCKRDMRRASVGGIWRVIRKSK